MIIVSDTSPISNLLKIGQLDLLREIYQSIIIPTAVFRELQAAQHFDAEYFRTCDWIEIRAIQDMRLFQSLAAELDAGEAEAIALAKELRADVLLMDEQKGRRKAVSLGLKVTGIAGVLLTAKGVGLLPEIEPVLNDLKQKAGFWLSNELRNYILKLGGEME